PVRPPTLCYPLSLHDALPISVSGLGQYIDMALLDCIVALGGNQVTGYLASGKAPHRYGNAHASLVPYQTFAAADGDIVVAVGNEDRKSTRLNSSHVKISYAVF